MSEPVFSHDVFLSHSAKEKAIVRAVAERLKKDGPRVWFDEWKLKPGDNLPKKIDDPLENSRARLSCRSVRAKADLSRRSPVAEADALHAGECVRFGLRAVGLSRRSVCAEAEGQHVPISQSAEQEAACHYSATLEQQWSQGNQPQLGFRLALRKGNALFSHTRNTQQTST